MTIGLGRKQFKTLNIGGNNVVDVYKGNERIFRDVELFYGFKFSIDTTLTSSGSHNTAKTFTLKRYASNGEGTPIKVKWGDGTEETVSLGYGGGSVTHTYDTAGEYDITIVPSLTNGLPKPGWLTGIFAVNNGYGTAYSPTGDGVKVTKILTPFPENSYIVGSASSGYAYCGMLAYAFHSLCNITSVPENIFDNITVLSNSIISGKGFSNTFAYFGQNTGANILASAKKLIDKFDYSSFSSMSEMFSSTFQYNGADSIDEDIFENVVTTNCTNFSDTFSYTFRGLRDVTSVPAGLFSSIDTSNGTNFSGMFSGTFSDVGYDTGSISLPADLFSTIDTSNGNTFGKMFASTFINFGYNSTNMTIPEHLFDSIVVNNGTIGSNSPYEGMFARTFENFGYNSKTLTIPEGLLKNVVASGSTVFSNAFSNMFYSCGHESLVAEIPEDLFSSLDTSSGLRFDNAFQGTFSGYGNKSTKQIPAGLFSSIDLSSATSTSGMFLSTFSSCTSSSISSGLFDFTMTNVTNYSGMFFSTFSGINYSIQQAITIPSDLFSCLPAISGVSAINLFSKTFYRCKLTSIPSTLFSSIRNSSFTKCDSMFQQTFEQCSITDKTIPAGLFPEIDTSSSTSFRQMFYHTFSGTRIDTAALSGMFGFLDTSSGKDFYSMFEQTFYNTFNNVAVTIPVDLFSDMDLSNATELSRMFTNMFQGCLIVEIPTGLLGGLKIPNISSNNAMLNSMFYSDIKYATIIGDPFYGMQSFSWVNASNASSVLYRMLAALQANDTATGDITTIVSHFGFTPNSRTSMFEKRVSMSGYDTVNSNWK